LAFKGGPSFIRIYPRCGWGARSTMAPDRGAPETQARAATDAAHTARYTSLGCESWLNRSQCTLAHQPTQHSHAPPGTGTGGTMSHTTAHARPSLLARRLLWHRSAPSHSKRQPTCSMPGLPQRLPQLAPAMMISANSSYLMTPSPLPSTISSNVSTTLTSKSPRVWPV